jgi:ABC-type siderophore export system fused ATPase/permease subunit
VISVTHDDRYLHVADRVVKMEYGAIVDHHFAAHADPAVLPRFQPDRAR